MISPSPLAFVLAAALTAPVSTAAGVPEIRLDASADGVTSVVVIGLERATLDRLRSRSLSYDEWTAVFPVTTGAAGGDRPTVWGSYSVEDDRVRFTPRFPLVPGQPYSARWTPPSSSGEPLVATFSLPRPPVEATTVVTAVYPSADELPANLLKLYVHFSAPMSRGEARRHLRLLTAAGEEVPAPFVAPEHELWSPGSDRLTVFFDPGRIKRGVGPHEALGPTLRQGESYRLAVDREWRDARGNPLREGFEKRFRVAAADRAQPRPGDWRLVAPERGGEPVLLIFPEALDRALLERLLEVVDERGGRVRGSVEIGGRETRWAFRPAAPWVPGSYEIRVGADLEDLAGNSLRRPFETSMRPAPHPEDPAEIRLPFSVP